MSDEIIIPEQLKSFRFIKVINKRPIELDWGVTNNYAFDDPILIEHLKKHQEYGVICGMNHLFVVDVDDPELQKLLLDLDFFKDTFTVKTGGKGLYHFYFYADIEEPKKYKIFKPSDKPATEGDEKRPNTDTRADVQGKGTQVVGPGSVNKTTGKKYEIVNNVPIKKINFEQLKLVMLRYDLTKTEEQEKESTQTKGLQKFDDDVVEMIKDKISIPEYLRSINIDSDKNPCECPFHGSQGKKCFSYHGKVWNCFHCMRSGDLFHLYQEYNKVDFPTALKELAEKTGIKTLTTKVKQLVSKKTKEKKSEDALEQYQSLDIKSYIIHRSLDETTHKFYISDFFIELTPDGILTAKEFRKKYISETGVLLPNIFDDRWVELINDWFVRFGQIKDNISNSVNNIISDTVVNEVESFEVVDDPVDSIMYNRCLYLIDEPDYIYVCNSVLDAILKKNQFKITMAKLKVLMDRFIEGHTKVIRAGNKVFRFFRFRKDTFPCLDMSKFNKKQQDKLEVDSDPVRIGEEEYFEEEKK